MNSDYRLSELAGIRDSEREDPGSVWPLNAVLALLGAAVLAVVFSFLDSRDPRYIFNPWTYAVITPVALALISTLLRTLVSQLVEKSMQIAFLLSLLIHVLLVVYAVNIVIFSRMWPDVMESLAVQREQLKRESLQARQYLQFSGSSQTTKRPDYLQFVPTAAEPTEVKLEQRDESLQLVPNEQSLLPSPEAQLERAAKPHMIERQQVAQAAPAIAQNPAPLSRSELSRELTEATNGLSRPLRYLREDTSASQTLQPTDLADARKNIRDQSSSPELPRIESPELRASVPASSVDRAELPIVESQVLPRNTELVRRSETIVDGPVRSSVQSIDSSSVSERDAILRPAESKATRRASNSIASLQPMVDVAGPRATATPKLNNTTLAERAEPSASSIARPGANASRAELPREVAGGRVSPPAPASAPALGPRELRSDEARVADMRLSPVEAPQRRRGERRAASPQLKAGILAGPTWSGEISNATGSVGLSPLDLASRAEEATASANDVANLDGSSAAAIDRSTLGASGQNDTFAKAPPRLEAVERLSENSGENDVKEIGSSGVAEAATGLERPRLGAGVSQLSDEVLDNALASIEPASAPPDFQRVERNAEGPTLKSRGALAADLARSELQAATGALPGRSGVQVLPEANLGTGSSGTMQLFGGVDGLRRPEAGGRGGVELPLDASMGPGGLADILSDSVAMLPRRRELEPEFMPPQIDPQRFSRQEIGGPLAAGSRVSVPTPAFKQRIDRLKENESQMRLSAEPQTELAIERGLLFLSKNQRPDGAWRLQDFDTQVLMRSDTAATGLSLLAFQGAGYTHREYKYAETVGRALRFLTERQSANGDLYIRQDPASDQNAWLYSHAIATLALCEAYGMTQDPELREPAQLALDFMVASQDSQRGGWRYRPGFGSDTSVTGWFMMAFKSGQLAGLEVPSETFDRIKMFLDRSQSPDANAEHLYRYNPYASNTIKQRHGLKPTAVMTSVGLLMRLYFGWSRDKESMQEGAAYLLDFPPRNGTRENSLRDTYYWYYATQVIFHMGGDYWERWHDRLYPILIDSQVTTGANAGSWDPMNPTPDLWARYGGRLYVTTMNILSLEVSYRHLPLYDATAE
jgi:hypothetical protein